MTHRKAGKLKLLMKQGEKVIKREEGVSVNIKNGQQELGNFKGTIYLTNQRLVMEQQTGMFSKTSTIVLDTPLSGIVNVGIEGMFGKKLSLQIPWKLSNMSVRVMAPFANQEVQVKALCGVKEPEAWINSINNAISG